MIAHFTYVYTYLVLNYEASSYCGFQRQTVTNHFSDWKIPVQNFYSINHHHLNKHTMLVASSKGLVIFFLYCTTSITRWNKSSQVPFVHDGSWFLQHVLLKLNMINADLLATYKICHCSDYNFTCLVPSNEHHLLGVLHQLRSTFF